MTDRQFLLFFYPPFLRPTSALQLYPRLKAFWAPHVVVLGLERGWMEGGSAVSLGQGSTTLPPRPTSHPPTESTQVAKLAKHPRCGWVGKERRTELSLCVGERSIHFSSVPWDVQLDLELSGFHWARSFHSPTVSPALIGE